MHIDWIKEVINYEDQKKDLEDYITRNSRLLDRLREICEDKERQVNQTQFTLSSYKTPSWSHQQAHINGYLAALREIKRLTITQDDHAR